MRWQVVIECVVATGCGAGAGDQIASDAPGTFTDGFVPGHDGPVPIVDSAQARWEEPLLFVRTQAGVSTLYLAREDGSNATPLADGEQPAWAPGRTAIAFAFREDNGHYEFGIYVMWPGENPRRLATGRDPAWSPDGTRIVFAVEDGLAIMDADGGNQSLLLRREDVPDLTVPLLSNPTFAPDGATLAFERLPTNEVDAVDIWLVDANGTDPRPALSPAHPSWGPSWSPLGTSVSHASYGTLDAFDIATGDHRTVLQHNDISFWSLTTWSPGGDRIVFSAAKESHAIRRIHSISVSGGSWPQLVPEVSGVGPYDDNDPQFAR